MKIENIKCFLTVVRTGSLHKAAEELFLTPQNLSTIIRNIENDVGEALFVRTSKGMVLSVEGKRFLPYANTINDAYQEYFNAKKLSNNILNFYTTPAMAAELNEINGRLLENQYYLSIQKRSVADLDDMLQRNIPGFYFIALQKEQLYKLGKRECSVLLEYNKALRIVHRNNPVLQNKVNKNKLLVIVQDSYDDNAGQYLQLDNINSVKDLMRKEHAIYNCVQYQFYKKFYEPNEWAILDVYDIQTIKHCLLYNGDYAKPLVEAVENHIRQLFDV